MEKVKELFGDKALTFAEFEAAVKGSKEVKLANLASGGYVDKAKLGAAETKIAGLEGLLAQRDNDLAELKRLNAADLQKQLATLQQQYADDTRELNDKLTAQTVSSHVDLALTAAKAKNLTAARALVKMENLKLDGDKVIGLEEQLKAITKENPWLFGAPEKNPTPPGGTGAGGIADEMTKWREEAGLPSQKQ